jgi:hypothetical protein
MYAWPVENLIAIPVKGSDDIGVTALVQRREALGVGRKNKLLQITGTGQEDSSGDIDFDVVNLSEELGIESQESVVVYRDTAYFLWQDGVYTWNSEGITCISDGHQGIGNVRAWFASDDYFERTRFSKAFAHFDPVRLKYRLYLAPVGGTSETRWVEYDLRDRTWWGPHKTDAFTPASAFSLVTSNNIVIPVVGSTGGDVYKETEVRTDKTGTAIAMDVITKRHSIGEPDLDKYFGQLSIFGKGEAEGNMDVKVRTGELDSTHYKSMTYNMSKSRQQLQRGGVGKHAELEFLHSTVGDEVEIYGYEFDDVHIVGRR